MESSYEERVEARTGLRPERFSDEYTTAITEADVAAAPAQHRPKLEAARRAGRLICGHVNATASAGDENRDDDYAAAAPFTSGITGARAAALTLRARLGEQLPSGMHWQYNIVSARGRTSLMRCDPRCDCAHVDAA